MGDGLSLIDKYAKSHLTAAHSKCILLLGSRKDCALNAVHQGLSVKGKQHSTPGTHRQRSQHRCCLVECCSYRL